ncbi:MAG: hypothetical protein HY842_01290 [Bacteroidetes bacterium]|nr:hypothetical protein [Bacteroidota bacterium]
MIIRIKFQTILFAVFTLLAFTSCAPSLVLNEDWSDFVPHADQSIFGMLQRQEVVEMMLVTDLDSILIKRKSEDYQPADFSYTDESSVLHTYQAQVRPRGKFRRMTCDFPPLKLKFSKKELEAAGLSDMNELKLVTHCLDDQTVSEGLIFREYLTYKLYKELTPNSLRAQLVKITYQDRSNKDYRMTRYGILLEDEEEFVWRTGGVIYDSMGASAESLQPTQEKIASVFQYMIGNTDWSIETLRNVKLLKKQDGKLIPVPYDFDFSAVVAAPYARPNTDLGQKRIGQRVFMGKAGSVQELYATLSYFRSKKQSLLGIVENFPLLDMQSKESILLYLNGFFDEIETQESAQQAMFGSNF